MTTYWWDMKEYLTESSFSETMQNNIMNTICRKTKTRPDKVKVRREGVMWRCEEEVRSTLAVTPIVKYSDVNVLVKFSGCIQEWIRRRPPTGRKAVSCECRMLSTN